MKMEFSITIIDGLWMEFWIEMLTKSHQCYCWKELLFCRIFQSAAVVVPSSNHYYSLWFSQMNCWKKKTISFEIIRSFVNFAHYHRLHWFFPFHGVKSWNAISLIAVNVHYHFQFPLEFHANLKCTPNCWIRCAFHTSLCRIGWAWKYPNMLPSKLCDYKTKTK